MKQAILIPAKFANLTAALVKAEEPANGFSGFRTQQDNIALLNLVHPETGVPYPIRVLVARRESPTGRDHTMLIAITVLNGPLGADTLHDAMEPNVVYTGSYDSPEGLVEGLERFIAAYQECFIYESEQDAEDEAELVLRHWMEDRGYTVPMFQAMGMVASTPWLIGVDAQPEPKPLIVQKALHWSVSNKMIPLFTTPSDEKFFMYFNEVHWLARELKLCFSMTFVEETNLWNFTVHSDQREVEYNGVDQALSVALANTLGHLYSLVSKEYGL